MYWVKVSANFLAWKQIAQALEFDTEQLFWGYLTRIIYGVSHDGNIG